MIFLRVILIISIFWMNGCALSNANEKDRSRPPTMMQVYAHASGQGKKDVGQFIENNLKEQKTFGFVKPYIPVVNEPVVRKVWVPDHKSEENSDVLVAGHWIYLMIQPATWFIDGKTVDTKFPVIIPTSNKAQFHQEK